MLTVADWLARLGEQELAALLRMRPDAMAAPQPLTLDELAERLSLPHGVMAALASVDLPSLQLLEALAALGDGAPLAEVRALLANEAARQSESDDDDADDVDDEPAGFQAVLTGLFRRGLSWPAGETLRLIEPLRDWPMGDGPLGLGPPAAALLPRLTADALRRIGREWGVPTTVCTSGSIFPSGSVMTIPTPGR